jgi:choline dehydrogenase-like flavoprotein
MDHYDVIIIGSGAGGGTLARHLAPSGKRILLLERGDWLPREPQNWSAADVFVDNRYVSPDTWYDAEGKAFQPQVHYCVGGATKMYGAALYRMRAEDFGELRHHGGISPAWPISYEAMEPYYTKAEQLYQVHGARGEDPTEPFASAPYDHPAVSHEPRIAQLSEAFAAAGLHPFHAPCGVMLNEGNMPYSNCVRCSTCDGFPCLVHAKSDAEVLGVRPALEHANVTLLTGAKVVALKTNPAGTAVTEVVVERAGEGSGTRRSAVTGMDGGDVTGTGGSAATGTGGGDGKGERETYAADIVVVSCGAANTAKLLLSSATDKHPGGLANGSNQVGRNYMFHNSQAVLAISKEPNPTVFQKTLGVNDYYFAGDAWEYPMGNIQMVGKSVADMYRGEKPLMTRLAPTFSLADVAEHAVDFWLSTEDIPQAENRVTVDRDGNLTLAYKASNDTARDRLFEQLRSLLGHLGMHEHHLIPRWAYLENKIPVAGVAHQAGTCRFGADPASSALDIHCKAHELDNLYVVDTSFFPSISAVNPALTAMANALRVGDHLLERLGANGH